MTAALVLATLASGASLAQTDGLTPNVDLNATIRPGPANAPNPATPILSLPVVHARGPLFTDEPATEGGWKGLARLLEALTPKVDTSVPLTASQITGRIEAMINRGDYAQALDLVKKRQLQLADQGNIGTDVQLMFLQARALSGLGRANDAIDVYRQMTISYPELPEPWNNLASEYVKQDKLDMARDALNNALASDPNYATARANLGDVELLLGKRAYDHAARLGAGGAAAKADQTAKVLKQ